MAYGYKTGGRRKGTPNRRSTELTRHIKRYCKGFNPVVEMIKLFQDEDTPVELKVYLLREITPYLFPKRKAVNIELEAEINSYTEKMQLNAKKGNLFENIEKYSNVFEKLANKDEESEQGAENEQKTEQKPKPEPKADKTKKTKPAATRKKNRIDLGGY